MTVSQADYSQLVELQSKLAEAIELTLSNDATVAFEIQQSQNALEDLATQVSVSDLAAKDELEETLESLVAEGTAAYRSLSKLSSRIGGSIDA